MATVRPFPAVRPQAALAHRVAALPYDVYTAGEAKLAAEGNPYSFLHVDKAEIDLQAGTNPHAAIVYEKAKSNFDKMMEDGVFQQDAIDCFYIYRLTREGRTQTGFVCCTDIDEYLTGVIKRHELTREDKEQDRIRHVDKLNANTGPIFLAYRGRKEIQELLAEWTKIHIPVYDFTANDGVRHQVWVIHETHVIEACMDAFSSVPNLYIADGHHRNASAVKVGLKRRKEHPKYTGGEAFNFYLSVLFPAEELSILDYNRVVKDLNRLSSDAFLERLKEKFLIRPFGRLLCKPTAVHDFGLYLEGSWYLLSAKPDIVPADIVGGLDVSILQKEVLDDILAIRDARSDRRIDFVGGVRGLDALMERVDSGEMKAAFALYPTSVEQLMQVADADLLMPPKSTWFEPKLRSGLFIHLL